MMMNNKLPKWYWVVAIFLLLWNIMGVLSFLAHVMITEEMIAEYSAAEQALYSEYPLWTIVIFALAVFTGLLGAIGLITKRKWAYTAFLTSLIVVIPQMIHNVFFTSSMEVYGTAQTVAMPITVIVLGVFSVWFSKYSKQKGWLR